MKEKSMGNYEKRMEENLKFKKRIIPYLPEGPIDILDFGCGTGILAKEIRKARPEAKVYALDINMERLEMAIDNDSADYYLWSIESAKEHSFDAIILNSVLHEIANVESFLNGLRLYLKEGGIIIVRDGISNSEGENKATKYKLKNPEDAEDFYHLCEDSVIGDLPLAFVEGKIFGRRNDVLNFLQTYTWGRESIEREKHEKFLRWDEEGYQKLGEMAGAKSTAITKVTQIDYFHYMDKLVKLKGEFWPTHAIVIYKF